MLRFWNIIKGELIIKINASHGKNYDSLSAMVTTSCNSFLVTADTSGGLKKSELIS